MKIHRYFFILVVVFISVTCHYNGNKILGLWTNGNRSIEFVDNEFIIRYNKFFGIQSIKGTYTIDGDKLFLSFKEYEDSNHIWQSTAGTKLASFKEVMQFSIKQDILYTYIISTKKTYEYKRGN